MFLSVYTHWLGLLLFKIISPAHGYIPEAEYYLTVAQGNPNPRVTLIALCPGEDIR